MGGRRASFNGDVCCGRALKDGVDDVGLVQVIIRQLAGSYLIANRLRVREQAVYAMGYSNGGFMASKLGRDLFSLRGFAAMAGHVYNLSMDTPQRTVSIHMMRNDEKVLYSGCCTSQLARPRNACCCEISERWSKPCVDATSIFH